MKILKQENEYRLISQFTLLDKFENKIYEFDYDCKGNCLIKDSPDLTLPDKVYDSSKKERDMIIRSFRHYNKNLGVLLSGKKGTGKTVDAKLLCKEVQLPIIMIRKQIPLGVDFIGYLNSIEQEFVLFVDEFEKIFEINEGEGENKFHLQKSFLSFMDGLNTGTKKLFLLTTNGKVDEHLMNRPSRIKYVIEYRGIDKGLAVEIIKDKVKNKNLTQDLIDNVDSDQCTIDVLTSIIEEINIHDKPYSSFKNVFNFKPESRLYNIFYQEPGNTEFKFTTVYRDPSDSIRRGGYCGIVVNGGTKTLFFEDSVDSGNSNIFIADYTGPDGKQVIVKAELVDDISKFII